MHTCTRLHMYMSIPLSHIARYFYLQILHSPFHPYINQPTSSFIYSQLTPTLTLTLPPFPPLFFLWVFAINRRTIFRKEPEERKDAYLLCLGELVRQGDCPAIEALVVHLIKKEGQDTFGRTWISPEVLQQAFQLLHEDANGGEACIELDDLQALLEGCIAHLRTAEEGFPDALMEALGLLALVHQTHDDFKEAAIALSSFKITDQCKASEEKQMKW